KLKGAHYLLRGFAGFMEDQAASFITADLALQWAMLPRRAQSAYWAQRLMAVRCFARHHSATDPRTQIPPLELLRYRPRRARPYLYTEQDIERLMAAAKALRPTGGLRGLTYATLLGLLSVTGLRISEALALTFADVDGQAGLLTIRKTKFGKARLVPLHPSAQCALLRYARQRDAYVGRLPIPRFFVSTHGRPLTAQQVGKTFRLLRHRVGLHAAAHWDEPQLHHFRHRLATESLLRWYRSGDDVEQRLPVLSTFLGHGSIASTYWYLSSHPELMVRAMQRLEQRWEKSP
ncbi:MAG TPA: tyrosine-type recombinase/integrase, partial [Acidobacteriaceae bacterium]|nr:tyrosine-type recombinase/integrase [Acidobacteriaceae bacterium]